MVKISVIIPVYNIEKYLARCLDSIINQTLNDIEIICVNDGSKDSSLDILESYAKKDARIKIINQENLGVSVARNNGIKTAQGEYISFVDSDDYVSSDFYEKMYNAAKNNAADIAVSGIKRLNDKYCIDMLTFNKEECTKDFENKIDLCNVPDFCHVWNKIYNRDMLLKSNIKFIPNRIYEDIPFTPQILYYSGKLVTVPDTYYYYWRGENTLVKSDSEKAHKDKYLSETETVKFFEEHGYNYFGNKTITKRYKIFGITIYKTKINNNTVQHFLLKFIKWETKQENPENKILVVRYGTIGDTIFASAFYRELRRLNPEAQIDALTDKIAGEVMKYCPYVDNLIPLEHKYKRFLHYYKLLKKYNTVYFLKNDRLLSRLAFFARVKNRIGFGVRRNFRLTKKFPYKNDRHEIDFYLSLLDTPIENTKTEVWVKDYDEKVAEILKNIHTKKVLIHTSSRIPQKNWTKDNWAEVIKYLSNEKGVQVFFTGGKADTAYYDDIMKIAGDTKIPPINLCGELKINETISFVKHMDLMIGIDSGVIHMAAALDINSILLNGPTSLIRWVPRSDKCTVLTKKFDCAPCCFASSKNKLCKHKDSECMKAISPQEVIDVINTKF